MSRENMQLSKAFAIGIRPFQHLFAEGEEAPTKKPVRRPLCSIREKRSLTTWKCEDAFQCRSHAGDQFGGPPLTDDKEKAALCWAENTFPGPDSNGLRTLTAVQIHNL
ncbi:hypothetical protein AVEN_122772-1 [Araneus ventricosus]|uniref:Uncharacterized protein n=1 Tax=Araneus ventricosus TaxID=182803 RepID=A0A4Y2WW94_ARAVE|nr:hypothetical protein AVEN_122772-1 [Araneus ventricosus]